MESLASKSYTDVITMLQDQHFENIMDRMLDRIPPNIDKRQGSVIYNALAPAAAELAQAYVWLESSFDLVFADTAMGEFLDKRVAESGIERQPATRAVWQAEFDTNVPAGFRFFLDTHNLYFVSLGNNQLQAETAGEVGNATSMKEIDLQPLETIPGLSVAQLTNLLIPGADEEDDQILFERYQVRVRREAVSANKAHYKAWAESVEGVGKAKVFPLALGEGTVKIVITDSNIEPATQSLINAVQRYIDPVEGHGEGEAPISARATVVSADWRDIDISARVSLESGRIIEEAKNEIEQGIRELFRTLAFEDASIRISAIHQILQRSTTVFDYSEVTIDGAESNLQLDEIEIPRIGQVRLYE